MTRPTLLFVSTRFLFPVDSGGKIRSTQVLRGMKAGRFDITLAMPSTAEQRETFAKELTTVCDRLATWPAAEMSTWNNVWRMRHLFGDLPIPVASDYSDAGRAIVARELSARPTVAVFDFPHAAVLAPPKFDVTSVMFTHNVEAEIFARHCVVAKDWLRRSVWKNQHRKMVAFEGQALRRFNRNIAVSARDGKILADRYGLPPVSVIDTGVDLDYFSYSAPPASEEIVFTGSMDWLANIDGIEFFMDEVWPKVIARHPRARMTVVGRSAPRSLIERAAGRGYAWTFTGFVDDVRKYIRKGAVYVIPLRVGGGTRLKVFEAMAVGCPMVSTAIGVEGLPVEHNRHYWRADTAQEFADAVSGLLAQRAVAERLSRDARAFVEARFSFWAVAKQFESICADAASLPQLDVARAVPEVIADHA